MVAVSPPHSPEAETLSAASQQPAPAQQLLDRLKDTWIPIHASDTFSPTPQALLPAPYASAISPATSKSAHDRYINLNSSL
jgi:hypothetical protein